MGFKIFDEQLVGVEMRKIKTLINKPFYIGFFVLELSKMRMYRFHYDYFMKQYPAAKMLFTDTDSLMYWVETADIYKELFTEREHFDFASFDKASRFFHSSNNKVIGKFKNEANAKPITECVGLRPKMYSFLIDDKGHTTEKHRAKGIKRGASREIRTNSTWITCSALRRTTCRPPESAARSTRSTPFRFVEIHIGNYLR